MVRASVKPGHRRNMHALHKSTYTHDDKSYSTFLTVLQNCCISKFADQIQLELKRVDSVEYAEMKGILR